MQRIGFFLVLVFLFVISFTTSTDFTQDLGRHLKLGEIIYKTGQIPHVNLFSYTNSSFPFINHHWLSEVVFYAVSILFGVSALTILKTALIFTAVIFSLLAASKKAGTALVSYLSLLLFPLLLERIDIRPELFGYALFAILIYILFFQKNKTWFYFIPFIMMLWINLHISFVFGLLLMGVYLIAHIKKISRIEIFLFILTVIGLFINPNGIGGVLYPFDIFKNYGYSIVENQNIFFLNTVTFNPNIRYFFLLWPLVIVALIILLTKKEYALSSILGIFFILPIWQIRHLPFFVFAAIPIIAYAYQQAVQAAGKLKHPYLKQSKTLLSLLLIIICLVCIVLFIKGVPYLVFDKEKSFGYAVTENQKEATDFVLKAKLPENIFNNFDIGGYAIYRLYPTYKVFVDNRPEAYPADFLQNVYIKLQQDEKLRKQIFSKYNIHTVFFSHTDMTPWGNAFLKQITRDPDWKVVFINDSIVILTDDARFKDLKSNTNYLNKIINTRSGHIPLLRLASFYSMINQNSLANKAFEKAKSSNPSSCLIKKIVYANTKNSPLFFEADSIRSNSWWCF